MPRARSSRGNVFEHGQPVRIAGHVGTKTEAGETGSIELHGEAGRVAGTNARHKNSDGIPCVSVVLDNGALVSVPERALKRG